MAEYEDVEDEGLDSAARKSSCLDLCFSWRSLGLTVKGVHLVTLFRNSLPSGRDLRRNDPLEAMSRY